MPMSKNYYSPDGRSYYTSDPYRVAFLVSRGCTRGKVDTRNPDSVLFEIIGDGIRDLIDELHSGAMVSYDGFVGAFKDAMSLIRDARTQVPREKVGSRE